MQKPLSLVLLVGAFFGNLALAEIKADRIFPTDGKKTEHYIKDGLFVGGDEAIHEVTIRDIRRAANAGFERVVIDFESTSKGESLGVPRPPYYQVAVNSDEKRILVSIWGNPKFRFDPKKVIASFKKSALVQNVVLLPRVEEDQWTFMLEMGGITGVETFHLSNPSRIILDLKKRG